MMFRRRPTIQPLSPSEIISRYADNPKLLKRARAGFENVSVETLDQLNVCQTEKALEPMKRALKAFADGLAEERAQ